MPSIDRLYNYPIKSGRAIPLQRALVTSTGFAWDRHWMAVDAKGVFTSQRTLPRLALVETRIDESSLTLSAPDCAPLVLPLRIEDAFAAPPPVPGQRHLPRPITVRVWKDDCEALDLGDAAARWISFAVRTEVRLVRLPEQTTRRANPDYAGSSDVPTSFVDGYPLLVVNRASLDLLNSKLPAPLPIERFRPNIVVAGLEPFAEDRIERLQIGEVTLRLVKPCTRCVITSINQQTGQPGENPLPTLRAFRFNKQLRGVTFGENAIIERGVGEQIAINQAVSFTTRSGAAA